MDPNETLRQIRERIQRWRTADDRADENDLADTVVLLFEDLDEWLSKGGFLPEAWRGSVPPARSAGVELLDPPIVGTHSWQERKAPGYGVPKRDDIVGGPPPVPPPNLSRRRGYQRPLVVPPSAHYTDPLGPPDPAGAVLPDDDYTPQAVNRTVEEED